MNETVLSDGPVEATPAELSGGEELSLPQQTQRLSRHQFFSLIFISVLGVAMIGLSVWEFSSIIGLETPRLGTGQTLSAAAGNPDDVILKTADTDGDGLTDYDELKVYGTSPYLKDSDGDGYDDKTELDSDNDPNCPKGQVCVSSEKKSVDELAAESVTTDDSTSLNSLVNATPDQVRAALAATGVFSVNELAKVSDEELMKIYAEALGGEQASGAAATGTSSGQGSGAYIASVDDLKATLKEAGLSDELLNGVDDATLMQLYQDALKQAAGEQ